MVHESCINLPRVIKITRHQHRLSHTPYLPPANWSCRVCYKNVDIKYGQYSCSHEGCSYVAHSKCATHKQVWDGRELDWEPEEPDDSEDIAPFRKIDVGLIKHFCHDHHIRLEKHYKIGRDLDKKCQACVLPIDSNDFYDCVQCEFSLHEVCANLPRKLGHALHNHPLVLYPSPLNKYYGIRCSTCFQKFTGFRYQCIDKKCLAKLKFQIDVRCVLLPDCFTHKSHEHPLYIPISIALSILDYHREKILCKGCTESCRSSHLKCIICEYVICYRCAILPNELHYKHDEHPLYLCHGESTDDDDKYLCEVCEKEVDSTKWFYTCNKCCITIHCDCIYGPSIYMKHGFTFEYDYRGFKIKVQRNSSSTRPICDGCSQRCPSHVYYNVYNNKYDLASCSFDCLEQMVYQRKESS